MKKTKKKLKSYWRVIKTRQRVEVVHTIWAAYATSLRCKKILNRCLGEVLRGGALSWPMHVVVRVTIRRWLYFFFSTFFSLSSTHPKLKKCPNFLYYFNCGSYNFYCSIFALNYFFYSFFLYFILFYFFVRFGSLYFNWYLSCFSPFF
jgi:hypothetical protein